MKETSVIREAINATKSVLHACCVAAAVFYSLQGEIDRATYFAVMALVFKPD